MSKILVVSDIHINDYAQRNPTNRFRLYQGSRTVAQNIIEVGRKEGCDIIVLAGDITEKSVIRPYIQAEIKVFLDTVMSAFSYGFLLLGNHDLDNKGVEQDISDACLGVMLPGNLYYAHQKTVDIDGSKFGFCNWMPEFDLSWIDGKVDVLFTHARICYTTGDQGGLFESQKLDETKFDLAICGDIHRAAQIGKYVSIGVPQKCKMGDSDDATGIVLDCSTKTWNWVNLNPNDNLMKFAYTTDLDFEGWHEEDHTWYVYKQENATINPDGSITNGSSVNTRATICFKEKPNKTYYIADEADGYLQKVYARILIQKIS
jgi:predicted phosphodiesterase